MDKKLARGWGGGRGGAQRTKHWFRGGGERQKGDKGGAPRIKNWVGRKVGGGGRAKVESNPRNKALFATGSSSSALKIGSGGATGGDSGLNFGSGRGGWQRGSAEG